MVRYALILFLCLGMFGCDTPCQEECGTLVNKTIAVQSNNQNAYKYVIDMDCTGDRINLTKWQRGNYDNVYAGDFICKSEL
jgi:hypothetical protein